MGMRRLSVGLTSSVKFFGVEFAPKNIPWERRTQMLGLLSVFLLLVAWPVSSYPLAISTILILLFFQCYGAAFLLVTFVIIPYMAWILFIDAETPSKGARSSKFIRGWRVWKQYNDYFPIKLVKTADLDPNKNYLFCDHPHGLICFGMFGCFATDGNQTKELFPGFDFSILTFDPSFFFPISRDIALLLGICSSSRKSMNHLLSKPGGGNVAILIPGGAPEALDFCPGSYILHLKDRKGFVKVALQNGSPLVPVFSFGENQILSQIPNPRGSLLRRIQDALQKRIQIPFPIFYGRGIFQYTLGFLPKRHPMTVVVGEPIPVEKILQPTLAQIDELHEKYVTALQKLFEGNKEKYSSPNDTLVIT